MRCRQRGICDRKGVYLSVRLCVRTRVNGNKTNESSVDILTPYERKIHVLFRTQNDWWGTPLLPEILSQ